MKKVGIFKSLLLPYSTTFILEQARALRKWRPVLLGHRRVSDGLSLDGFEFRILPGPRSGLAFRLGRAVSRRIALSYSSSAKILRNTGCDLIHAHFGTDAVEIWPAVKSLRLPMLVTLHGYDINIDREWWEAGHAGTVRRDYPRRLLAMADEPSVQFIAVSNAIREQAVKFGIPPDKITVRHIGVDTRKFSPTGSPISERAKRILFVGRLIENKGVEYLIRAFEVLRSDVLDAQLVVAGDGPQLDSLRQLATTLGVPVQFLGAISSDEVKRQLDQARVLCLPSVTLTNGASEGFGMVLLEAQASGVPVVTSSKGGRTEALEHALTGFAFDERDVIALAEYLTILLTDTQSLNQMSLRAVEFVRRKFDISECTRQMEEIYDSLGGCARTRQ